MIYQLSLQTTGLAVGILLLVSHTAALVDSERAMRFAKALPRSWAAAGILLAIATVWSFLMLKTSTSGNFPASAA